jgi:hypothetical protein
MSCLSIATGLTSVLYNLKSVLTDFLVAQCLQIIPLAILRLNICLLFTNLPYSLGLLRFVNNLITFPY